MDAYFSSYLAKKTDLKNNVTSIINGVFLWSIDG